MGHVIDQASFHGFKLTTLASGEPFNSQVWQTPIQGQLDYPDEILNDGELMYSNYEEKVEWEQAQKDRIHQLNAQSLGVTDPYETITDGKSFSPSVDKSKLVQDALPSPWEPFSMFLVERTCKNGNNVVYVPKAKVGPCYDWRLDTNVDHRAGFFEQVRAFMIGSEALMEIDENQVIG